MTSLVKKNEPFEPARDQEAANYYAKAIEMANYAKDIDTNPSLVKEQEEWVRERLRSGKSANLLERIDLKLGGESLPMRKDLIEKYDKKLMIRGLFLEKLIADDLNDAKAYRKGITIKNAIIVGGLDLSNAVVLPTITISNCVFLGKILLVDSWFKRELNFEGSHFLGVVAFISSKVGHIVEFDKAVFQLPVFFNDANIAEFSASETRFQSTALFDYMKVRGNAIFNNAVFREPVSFLSANVSEDFKANETRFQRKANFGNMKVGRIASFNKAVFRGPFDIRGGNIAGQLQGSEARFESEAAFYALQVGDSAIFGKAVFRGPVSFLLANLGSLFCTGGTRFENLEEMVSFYSLKVGRAAVFTDAVFRGPVNFGCSNMGELDFVRTTFADKKEIVLDGMTYNNIYTRERDYSDHNKVLEILRHMEGYRSQPYKHLELYYAGRGDKEKADAVFVEGQWEEWKAVGQGRYLPSNILKLVAAWLSRALDWVIAFVFAFILYGMFVFSRPGMFENSTKLPLSRAFCYSVGLFLPFVTLGVDKFYQIRKNAYFLWGRVPLEFYYYVHQLFGYISFSIVIVAVAGIIK